MMSSHKVVDIELQDEFSRKENTIPVINLRTNEQQLITGIKRLIIHTKLKLSLIKIAMNSYDNPLDWVRSLQFLIKLRRRFLGDHSVHKMVKAGDKYYMGLYTPGWNSKVYEKFIISELHQYKPVKQQVNRFNSVIIAITKKCALQCEHCFEWDSLNKKDVLTPEMIIEIVAKIQHKGVGQIQFSGGEPLMKIDVLLEVLKQADKKITDFWVDTSGFKLTKQNASNLKNAGLTGVIISLDHFIPEKHNTFRGFKDAYYWVENAVNNAKESNLVVALSLCATRDFVSIENFLAYMDLAKKLKVSFVQILESKAVGHYADKDVTLKQEQIQILEDFFVKMNFGSSFNNYPLISYHGYYQRRQGCFSAGTKGIYIDTDGQLNPCPFCHNKMGKVLDDNFEENLEKLKFEGCGSFKSLVN